MTLRCVGDKVEMLELTSGGQTVSVPLQGRFFLFELSGGGAKPSPETPEIELVAYDGSGQELARQKSRREFNEPPLPLDFSGQTPLIEIKTRRTGKPIQLYVVEREGERCRVRVSPGGTGSGCGGRAVKRTEVAVHPNQIGRPARDAPPLG